VVRVRPGILNRIAAEVQPGEAEYDRLPQTAQSGDPDAAGAVRVQLKISSRLP